MKVVAWAIWGVGVLVCLYAIRLLVISIPTGALSRAYGRMLLTFSMCTSAGLAATLLTGYSKLHLIWMLPVVLVLSLIAGFGYRPRTPGDNHQ